MNALQFAAHCGHIEAMEWLVEHAGADVMGTNEHGNAALFYATELGHLAAMEWLFVHGADANATNKDGRTCIHATSSLDGATPLAAIALLLKHGANVNARVILPPFLPVYCSHPRPRPLPLPRPPTPASCQRFPPPPHPLLPSRSPSFTLSFLHPLRPSPSPSTGLHELHCTARSGG
jgi:ankyrin repeat protein